MEKRGCIYKGTSAKGKEKWRIAMTDLLSKKSYANWAEVRCAALIYTRSVRDWRE